MDLMGVVKNTNIFTTLIKVMKQEQQKDGMKNLRDTTLMVKAKY